MGNHGKHPNPYSKPCPAKKAVTWSQVEEFPDISSQEGGQALPQCSLLTQALRSEVLLSKFCEGRKCQGIIQIKMVDLTFDKFNLERKKKGKEEEGEERKRREGGRGGGKRREEEGRKKEGGKEEEKKEREERRWGKGG